MIACIVIVLMIQTLINHGFSNNIRVFEACKVGTLIKSTYIDIPNTCPSCYYYAHEVPCGLLVHSRTLSDSWLILLCTHLTHNSHRERERATFSNWQHPEHSRLMPPNRMAIAGFAEQLIYQLQTQPAAHVFR